MIPGSFPIAPGLGPPRFKFKTSATFSRSGPGGTVMTFPASIVPGDLIVELDWALAGSVPAYRVPPGFTTAVADTFPGSGSPPPAPAGFIFNYKYAVASDAGLTFTGMNSGGISATIILVFESTASNFLSYTSADPHFDLGFGGGAGPPPQTVVGGPSPTITFGLYMQSGGTFNPTFSPAADASVGFTISPSFSTQISYKIFNSGSTNVVVDLGGAPNTNGLASCRIDGI